MTSTGDADDVGLLLDEAAYRLRCARKCDPLDDPRVLCENAHDAIEFSLNAVIVATGKPYRRTHDLAHLADTAASARLNYFHPDAPGQVGEFQALDIRAGETLWKHRRAPCNAAALTTAGGLVFVGDRERYVFAYDAASGEQLWQSG